MTLAATPTTEAATVAMEVQMKATTKLKTMPPAPDPDVLATFPFQRLPKELQLMVWEAAIDNIPIKYETYQLPVPAWKFFSTQPWYWGDKDTTWLRLDEVIRQKEEGVMDEKQGKEPGKIYMRPNWPNSEIGRLSNVCVESRWCVLKWLWRGLEESGRTEHGEYLVKERAFVLRVLGSVVGELGGRLRG